MEPTPNLKPKPAAAIRWLKWALIAAFLVAAAVTAYLTFIIVRDIVTSWELASVPAGQRIGCRPGRPGRDPGRATPSPGGWRAHPNALGWRQPGLGAGHGPGLPGLGGGRRRSAHRHHGAAAPRPAGAHRRG